MNKGELIDAVAAELEVSRAAATRVVEAVMTCITNGIKQDTTVTIVGFGSFTVKTRKARTVRNPSTGELMELKPSTTVGFRPSQALKETMGSAAGGM